MLMVRGHRSSQKGSSTVEAAIIFPVILLSIAAVMYICILLYQKAYIQSVVDMTVERGCATWNNPEKDTAIGSIDKMHLKSGGLYWRLFDPKKPEKARTLKRYIQDKISAFNLLGSSNKVDISIEDHVLYKKLIVRVDSEYRIPAGKALGIFGLNEYYKTSAESEGVVNEPVEFIRNTDFILDVEKELEKDHPGYGKVVEGIRGVMSNVEKKIEDVNFPE